MYKYKYLLLILVNISMRFVGGFTYINIVKKTILLDTKMPSVYLENGFFGDNSGGCYHGTGSGDPKFKNKFFSAEHIFPQSLLNNKHTNDMHNIIKTLNKIGRAHV